MVVAAILSFNSGAGRIFLYCRIAYGMTNYAGVIKHCYALHSAFTTFQNG